MPVTWITKNDSDLIRARATVGDASITVCTDGTALFDGGAMFGVVPKALWSKRMQADGQNRVAIGLNCVLVRIGGKTVLIETGFGNKLAPKLKTIMGTQQRLPASLVTAGIAPEQVDIVINTHLHWDHCGWNTVLAADGAAQPYFPNAQYIAHRGEVEHGRLQLERDRVSYVPANYEPLIASGQMRLIDGMEAEICPGVRVECFPGHTAHLLTVHIERGGEHACFVSDLLPTTAHLPLGWVMAFDLDPLRVIAERKRLYARAVTEGWLVLLPHDHRTPVTTLRMDENGVVVSQDSWVCADEVAVMTFAIEPDLLTPSLPVHGNAAAQRRSELLRELQLLDEAPDAEMDDLVTLATIICGKPMGAITLLDDVTMLTRARVGVSGCTTVPVEDSMCQFTIQGTGLMVVEDLQNQADMRHARIWLDAGIRFYAGMPLVSEGGTAFGALCVMDSQPSTLTAEQQTVMAMLGRQVSRLLQTRNHALAMERMAKERDREKKMIDLILDHVPVSIYLKDRGGHLRFYNQALADRFGIDRTAWIGKTNYDLWPTELADELKVKEDLVFETGKANISMASVPEPDGRTSHFQTHETRCISVDGQPMLAGSAIDLTEQMRHEHELRLIRDELQDANEKLSSLALTDALTGLWNRRAFDARLETDLMASYRNKRPLSLLLLDVDHFKSINDRFGHPYGDTVLRELATILNNCKRVEDVAARFGGEEFAILLPDTGISAARNLAERILQAVRTYAWDRAPVAVSIGMAMCRPNCVSDTLIDEADSALYCAKRGGRDCVVLYSDPA